MRRHEMLLCDLQREIVRGVQAGEDVGPLRQRHYQAAQWLVDGLPEMAVAVLTSSIPSAPPPRRVGTVTKINFCGDV